MSAVRAATAGAPAPPLPAVRRAADAAFFTLLAAHAGFAVVWLGSGLVGAGLPEAASPPAILLDYVFSALGLGLGLFVVVRRPHSSVARLLAVGMIGTAAAFNLQSHVLLDVAGTWPQRLHIALHHIAAGVAYVLALVLLGSPSRPFGLARSVRWVAVGAVTALLSWQALALGTLGFVMLFGLLIPAVGAGTQWVRSRRAATSGERREARFLVLSLSPALLAGSLLVTLALTAGLDSPLGSKGFVFRALAPPFALIPVALLVGIVRFHFLDIEVVVSKAIAYGALAGVVSLAYVGLVTATGAAVRVGGDAGLWVSLAATMTVALATQPLRGRLQRLADRIVFGGRAVPYEVLAGFSQRIGTLSSLDNVVSDVAAAAAAAAGGGRARVRVFIDGDQTFEASAPAGASSAVDAAYARTVDRGGERLGEVEVWPAPGAQISRDEVALLDDLCSQVAVALHNARLTIEVRARLEQFERQSVLLQDSRRRLLASRDDERRRVRRQLSDGVTPRLEKTADLLAEAEPILGFAPSRTVRLLDEASTHAQAALDELRRLARETFPPVLQDGGVVAALRADERRADPAVRVRAPVHLEGRRFHPLAESVVYFCARRMIDGAASGDVTVDIEESDGNLCAVVAAPGGLGDEDVALVDDRVAAAGGTVELRRDSVDARRDSVDARRDVVVEVRVSVPVRPDATPPTPVPTAPARSPTSE